LTTGVFGGVQTWCFLYCWAAGTGAAATTVKLIVAAASTAVLRRERIRTRMVRDTGRCQIPTQTPQSKSPRHQMITSGGRRLAQASNTRLDHLT